MANANNVVFCSATAEDRIDQAYVLFRSIKNLYPDSLCVFDGINCTGKQLDRLEDMGVVTNNFTTDALPDCFDLAKLTELKEWHLKEKGYIAYTEVGLLSAAWRLHMIPRLMSELERPMMWLDSDCIMRKNIDGFLEKAENYDFSVHYRPKNKDESKILSSVFLVNPTELGKKYCSLLEPVYKEVFHKDKWWADPHTLGVALKRSKVKFWNFNVRHYNDSSFSDSAYIWHAKHSGLKNPKWKKAFNRLLKQA